MLLTKGGIELEQSAYTGSKGKDAGYAPGGEKLHRKGWDRSQDLVDTIYFLYNTEREQTLMKQIVGAALANDRFCWRSVTLLTQGLVMPGSSALVVDVPVIPEATCERVFDRCFGVRHGPFRTHKRGPSHCTSAGTINRPPDLDHHP